VAADGKAELEKALVDEQLPDCALEVVASATPKPPDDVWN